MPPAICLTLARAPNVRAGQTFELVRIGRACHATSERAFAEWARSTTVGELAKIDVDLLSQVRSTMRDPSSKFSPPFESASSRLHSQIPVALAVPPR